ncbi:MAG: hypothetical protein U1C48_05525 [Methylotenera sp.]|nr:hypothetical protein [Methylotenera sp.]
MKIASFYQTVFIVLSRVCLLLLISTSVIAADAYSGYYGGNGQNQQNGRMQRDPFTTSDKMYGEVGAQAAQRASNAQGFIPGYGVQTVPKMRLKGFVTKANKQAAAILDIDGVGVYLVSEGDEIGLQAMGQNSVLKIIGVSANGVKVQSGQVNQVIVVR